MFSRLNFVRSYNGISEFLPPVSVIICSKNEADNLLRNLKVVLIQQYTQFEIIVVNDQSTDNSIDVLVDYYKRNKNLKIVNIPAGADKPYAGKKHALVKGIEVASFDHIVVTDADCRPASTHWLAKMVGTYMAETQIVLGHSPFEKRKSFLNKIIRYENFITALQYFGFAKMGLPYMGVGRNLSYKKELFESFKGFEKNKTMLTGDDDLLVSAKATSANTEICIDKSAFTYTQPKETFSAWLNQKRRHLHSGFKYKIHHQFLLFLFAATGFLFYVSFIVVVTKDAPLTWVLVAAFGLIMAKLILSFRIFKKLGASDLIFLSPILDIIYSAYLLIIFFLLLLKPKNNWT